MTFLLPIGKEKLRQLPGRLKSKTYELDPISTQFIQDHLDAFDDVLVKIVNKSFEEQYFSKLWKTAIIRPLLKMSNLDHIDKNYRPVSNLSFVSKLVEHAALDQLVHHNDYNNLSPVHQSAYKSNHSCETL